MRYQMLILSIVLLSGCASTRLIEANWDSPRDVRKVERLGRSGKASVRLPLATVRSDYRLEGDSLVFLRPPFQPVSREDVREIRYLAGKRRGLSAVIGAAIGAAAGLGFALVYNPPARQRECENWLWGGTTTCTREGPSDSSVTLMGALIGTLVGLTTAPSKFEIYRFRTDTPQQMSVVIGVGPTTTANGVGR